MQIPFALYVTHRLYGAIEGYPASPLKELSAFSPTVTLLGAGGWGGEALSATFFFCDWEGCRTSAIGENSMTGDTPTSAFGQRTKPLAR